MAMPGIEVVTCHMCYFGMSSADELGKGLVKKPTKLTTNSWYVARTLDKRCTNVCAVEGDPSRHRHVQLMSGRAKACQVYPCALCQAVCI